MKAKLIGHPVGCERQNTHVKRSYRAFYVESISMASEESLKGDMRRIIDEVKNAVEGSQVLAYVLTDPKDSLPFYQNFALMEGVETDGTTPLTLEISGELHTAITPYPLFEVHAVQRAGKPGKSEPKFAPIDYDETVELDRKETGPEYTGSGVGFEL